MLADNYLRKEYLAVMFLLQSFCIFLVFLAVYHVFPCVCTAGRRCSREDQPCVPGWEKRPGCDVLWPEALLWQHLPGVAVRGFWFSVAPSMGPLWVGLPRPGERYCTTEETGLVEMTSAQQRQRDRALGEPQSHTLTLSHQEVFF